MKSAQDIEKDLASIREVMEKSTKFISLSGISGVLAGIYALVGSVIAYYLIYYPHSPFGFRFHYINEDRTVLLLMITASAVLILSLTTGYIFTSIKAKRNNQSLWNSTSERLLINMAVPLIAGGLFILVLISRGYFMIVAPASMLFYGLSLINASNFTYRDVRYLGYCQVILGLLCAALPGYGLIFWAIGFGILHIVYGISMHLKYDR